MTDPRVLCYAESVANVTEDANHSNKLPTCNMRFNRLPQKVRKVWTDLPGLKAICKEYVSLANGLDYSIEQVSDPEWLRDLQKCKARIAAYIRRIGRQIFHLVSGEALRGLATKWRQMRREVDNLIASLDHYKATNVKRGDEVETLRMSLEDRVVEAKEIANAWSLNRRGDQPFYRHPKSFKLGQRSLAVRLPDGSLRYFWAFPEVAQYLPKATPAKAVRVVEDYEEDEFYEEEEGEE